MALFAFFLSAAIGGGGVVALRERPKPAAVVGLLATAVCLLAAVAMPGEAALVVGSSTLEVSPYVRLFLVAAALALLVSQVAGLAHGWQRELPLATLGALGLVGIALTVGTPAAAMLTVAAAGTFVVIASLERAISMPAVRAAASGFRLAAIAGFMGLVAMATTGDDPIFVAPDVLAGATLLMAAAVALRVGAIPLHAPVARLIERARTAALPLIAAWVPAAFAIVALGWISTVVALGATTPIVVVVVAFGVLTIGLASAVVLIDDDLVRWLGYGIVADGGFVLLAIAGDTTAAISAGLAWLVCFALARSVMACVVLGFQGAFDARRTRELDGWLRRTPLLGLALAGALVIDFGLPGTLAWQARLDLAQGAVGEQLGLALVTIALLPVVPIGRLAWTGLRPPGDVVSAGRSERFLMPPPTVVGAAAEAIEAPGATTSEPLAIEPEPPATGPEPPPPEAVPEPMATGPEPLTPSPEPDAEPSLVGEPAAGIVNEPAPAPTLSSRGRASRAARRGSPPTIVAPGPGGGAPGADGGARIPGTTPPTEPSSRESVLARMRRVGTSLSTSAGPLRTMLRELPAVWALDRTLIASLATLLLALVGLAFATDLVGLGAAAGLGALANSTP